MLVINSKPKNRLVNRKTTLKPIVENPKIPKKIQKKLEKLFAPMYEEVNELFKVSEEENMLPKQIVKLLRKIYNKYDELSNTWAKSIAKIWTSEISYDNRDQLYDQIKERLGIERGYLLDNEEFEKVFDQNLADCVALIKSISSEYIGRVAEALKRQFKGESQPDGRTLAEQIEVEGGVSKTRAKIIARDQTAKMNSQMNQVRQQNLGIEEYIWKTSKDSRVVGNPSGHFPKGNKTHGNHFERDGKIFRWDTPPFDGHPGIPINCRCVAIPIIDFEKLKHKDEYSKN